MLDLILLGIINSLIITGVYEVLYSEEKNGKLDRAESGLFGWVSFRGDRLLPYTLTKPLWNCPVCMSSVHSTYVYWGYQYLFGEISIESLIVYPAYMLMLAGINCLMLKLT